MTLIRRALHLFSFCLCVFCFCDFCFANSKDIVINELAWMGNLNSSNDEWIELKNLTSNDISLEGWTLIAEDGSPSINLSGSISASGFFILERSDDDSVPSTTADFIYSGALGNSGENLELRDSDGNLVDSVSMSDAWFAGDNDTKKTMVRDGDGVWATSSEVGGSPRLINTFESSGNSSGDSEGEENDSGTDMEISAPEDNNTEAEEVQEVETESPSTEVTESDSVVFSLGDILVNEFVSDPSDGEVEWIELYNTSDKEIDLEGWSIEEGSSAKTSLEGTIGHSGDSRYFVIEKPSGSLNNKGDIIIIRDSSGRLIEKVVYGDWENDIDSNAPYASDPFSVARIINGYTSFNNKNDFAITDNLSKGSANIISNDDEPESEVSLEDRNNYDYSDSIIISEVYPNPFGTDKEGEFIELFNRGEVDVSLLGWVLGDNSQKRFVFSVDVDSSRDPIGRYRSLQDDSLVFKSGEYLVIYRGVSGIALNNTSDSVKLFRPLEDEAFEVAEYSEVKEGWSYNKTDVSGATESFAVVLDNRWEWSELISPGEANVIKSVNHAPEIFVDWPMNGVIGIPLFFDSSDTVDGDNDILSFFWDFGDGFTNILASPEHTFFESGVYTVILSVSDGENEVALEKIVKVGGKVTEFTHPSASLLPSQEGIVINEVLPNPEGVDKEGEWIELRNIGSKRVNLLNWAVDDSEGGSKPYIFNSDIWLEPGGIYTLDRVDSSIALNNSNDSVRLFNDLEEMIDEIEYEKVIEGESYAKGENGKLFWTSVITPGSENIVKVASSKSASDVGIDLSSGIGKKTVNEPLYISLDKIIDTESGDFVITKGIVSVLPGVLGSQYFYIGISDLSKPVSEQTSLEENYPPGLTGYSHPAGSGQASPSFVKATAGTQEGKGIQVYSYKKDFPDFRIGDFIEVSGEIGVSYGERRIKTKIIDDMVILSRDNELKAIKYECVNINEDIVGSLISIEGEIVERKSSVVFLDDGTDEARVYIKSSTGISPKSLIEGESAEITGIVGMTKSGIRIMPRSVDDIIIKDVESSGDSTGQVLGEISTSDEWGIASRNKKIELFKYVLVIACSIIIVLGFLLAKVMRSA